MERGNSDVGRVDELVSGAFAPDSPIDDAEIHAMNTSTPAQDTDMRLERRRAARVPKILDAKVFCPLQGRFLPAQTSNVSDSGLLLWVDRSRTIDIGEEIDVAVAESPESTVVSRTGMRRARVVRVVPLDFHTQAIAVAYGVPQTIADQAGLSKAA
jgi:PilZ domain-containing protein